MLFHTQNIERELKIAFEDRRLRYGTLNTLRQLVQHPIQKWKSCHCKYFLNLFWDPMHEEDLSEYRKRLFDLAVTHDALNTEEAN